MEIVKYIQIVRSRTDRIAKTQAGNLEAGSWPYFLPCTSLGEIAAPSYRIDLQI